MYTTISTRNGFLGTEGVYKFVGRVATPAQHKLLLRKDMTKSCDKFLAGIADKVGVYFAADYNQSPIRNLRRLNRAVELKMSVTKVAHHSLMMHDLAKSGYNL